MKKTEQKACRGERMLLHHNFSIGPFKTESRLKSWQGSIAVQPDRARPGNACVDRECATALPNPTGAAKCRREIALARMRTLPQ